MAVSHVVSLLNRILDKGLINSTDVQACCPSVAGIRALKYCMVVGLVRRHNIRIVSSNHTSRKKMRFVYSITRLGLNYLLMNDSSLSSKKITFINK